MGRFGSINGVNRFNAARLNSDGTLDANFVPPTGTNIYHSAYSTMALQPDGQVMLGGYFLDSFSGPDGEYFQPRSRYIRLDTHGTFSVLGEGGEGSYVSSIALQPDGKVLIGGEFTTVNGALRSRVARLYGDFTGPSNIALAVAISSPPDGSSFVAPANVAIQINASDSDGFVARVEIRSGEAPIAATNSDPFEFTWNGVPAGNYTLTAVATDNLGLGSTSIPVNITVATSPLPPAAPSGLTATAVSRSKISLSWLDNSGDELGFKVERSTKGKPFKQIAITGPNVTTYTDTRLSAGQKYTYRARAYNSVGDSAYLSPATAKTAKRAFTLFGL